jgi:protein involved in polysaccharide export with SLBB domain
MVGIANYVAKVGGLCFAVGLGLTFGGCAGRSPDPAQLGRFRPTPAVNVILDSLGVADEPAVAWENGEDPKPRDVVPVRNDGTLRPGDTVRISIFELLREGVTETNDYLVSETGKISLPEVGPVQAGGLTAMQLEQAIKQALTPGILKNPFVSAVRVNSQPQMFAILGVGVTQPGRYALPTQPFRLTDALAAAGGLAQFNVSHVYISRSEQISQPGMGLTPGQEMELIDPQAKAATPKPSGDVTIPPPIIPPDGVPQPSQPAEKFETRQEMLDLITPSAKAKPKVEDRSQKTKDNTDLGGLSSNEADISASVLPGGFRILMPKKSSGQPGVSREEIVQSFAEFGGAGATAAPKPPAGEVRWVFQDGQWVPVPVAGSQRTGPNESAAPQQVPDLIPAQPPVSSQPPRPGPQTPVAGSSTTKSTQEQPEWVFQDGRWVQVRTERTESAKPPLATVPAGPTLPIEREKLTVESEPDLATQNRVIKVPLDRLLAGDVKYNIYIKPGDVIHVPADVVGEFCITGNVVRSGYFSMTGRSMTLKQAIAAAGGLTPMAFPKYCEVIRRIPPNKEEIVMVDLEKIVRGEQPDFLIKPNDLINVGTHPSVERSAP